MSGSDEEQGTGSGGPVDGAGRRGRGAAVAVSVLLAVSVAAGVGHTVVTVNGADRDAGAPVWKFPRVTVEAEKTVERSGLAGMLVPYGTDGWVAGPDIGEFGSDAELSGAQAAALRKKSVRELPRAQRKLLEAEIDRQGVRSMAMRSYFSGGARPYLQNEGIYSVSVVLVRMEDRSAVRDLSLAQNRTLDALDGFREGPRIKGDGNAECFRAPAGTADDLDVILCSGYVGDVLVSATAYGAEPLDSSGFAEFLRTQLDRVDEPGEAV